MFVNLGDFLDYLINKKGPSRVCEAVEVAVRSHHRANKTLFGDEPLDAFLRRVQHLIHAWYKVGKKQAERDELLSILRRVGFDLQALLNPLERPDPWHRWEDGDTVVVLLPARWVEVPSPQSAKPVRRLAVDYRDADAAADLLETLRRFNLIFRANLEFLPTDCTEGSLQTILSRLDKRKDVGLMACIGSANVNKAAFWIAEQICDDIEEPEALLRWYKPPGDKLSAPAMKVNGQQQVGASMGKVPYARVPDEEIVAPKGGRHKKRYADAGLLALDVRKRPFLALFAGHSGCATQAAVKLLDGPTGSPDAPGTDIERFLALSRQTESLIATPPERILQVVLAEREKKTKETIDDLKLVEWSWATPPSPA